jgi:hypothetical protein
MSEISLIVFLFFLILLVLVAAAIFLLRSVQRSAQQQIEAANQTLAIRLEMAEKFRVTEERQSTQAEEQRAEANEALMETLQKTTAASLKAMEQLHLTSMTGLQASESSTNKLLASTVALLGAKDPMAYQQIIGHSTPQDPGAGAYTAADDTVEEQLATLGTGNENDMAEAMKILDRMGVGVDGFAGA